MAKQQLRARGLAALQDQAETLQHEVRALQTGMSAPVVLRAMTLGFVGGLRSMAPLALLDWTRKQHPAPTNDIEQFLDSPAARVIASSLSAGELVADKLPATPSRISPLPLLGRLGVGAIAGASIFRRYHQPLAVGAALGALGAGAGSYAGYYARNALASSTKIPPWMLGLLEDGLTFGIGFLAVRKEH